MVGISSFVFNLFKSKTTYLNIKILTHNTEENLNALINYEKFSSKDYSFYYGESLLLAPVSNDIKFK